MVNWKKLGNNCSLRAKNNSDFKLLYFLFLETTRYRGFCGYRSSLHKWCEFIFEICQSAILGRWYPLLGLRCRSLLVPVIRSTWNQNCTTECQVMAPRNKSIFKHWFHIEYWQWKRIFYKLVCLVKAVDVSKILFVETWTNYIKLI